MASKVWISSVQRFLLSTFFLHQTQQEPLQEPQPHTQPPQGPEWEQKPERLPCQEKPGTRVHKGTELMTMCAHPQLWGIIYIYVYCVLFIFDVGIDFDQYLCTFFPFTFCLHRYFSGLIFFSSLFLFLFYIFIRSSVCVFCFIPLFVRLWVFFFFIYLFVRLCVWMLIVRFSFIFGRS